ncbi:MAG: hypothetical protein Kow0074_04520 [Candidatus Zixiibacteriota bacterium]
MTIQRQTLTLVVAFLLALTLQTDAWAGTGDGTVLGATKVLDNGPDAERFNLVVLAEGFRASEQEIFNNAVDQIVASLFNYPPLDTLTGAFNVYRINVASDQSGADNPIPCDPEGFYVNTYFDATYCAGGIPRALVVNNSTAFSVMNTYVPTWDQGVVIVNDTKWGGTGGSLSTTSLASGWENIVIHEMGHSAFGLADEYEYYAGCGIDNNYNHPAGEPAEPNVTVQTVRENVKWNHLILPSTPLPTTQNANCTVCDPQGNPFPASTVGLYEGAHYYHCDCYRPQFSCMMRNLATFCAVCQEVIVETMTPYLPEAPCVCDNPLDFDANQQIDAIDLSYLIDVLYFNGTNIQDPDCPSTRADFNNNNKINSWDLNYAIDYIFFGGVAPCNACDGSGPGCDYAN